MRRAGKRPKPRPCGPSILTSSSAAVLWCRSGSRRGGGQTGEGVQPLNRGSVPCPSTAENQATCSLQWRPIRTRSTRRRQLQASSTFGLCSDAQKLTVSTWISARPSGQAVERAAAVRTCNNLQGQNDTAPLLRYSYGQLDAYAAFLHALWGAALVRKNRHECPPIRVDRIAMAGKNLTQRG